MPIHALMPCCTLRLGHPLRLCNRLTWDHWHSPIYLDKHSMWNSRELRIDQSHRLHAYRHATSESAINSTVLEMKQPCIEWGAGLRSHRLLQIDEMHLHSWLYLLSLWNTQQGDPSIQTKQGAIWHQPSIVAMLQAIYRVSPGDSHQESNEWHIALDTAGQWHRHSW